jgi:hypothetical protein
VAAPSAVEERRLEDHVPPGAHRGVGLSFRRSKLVGGLGVAGLDLMDRASLEAKRGEVGGLVLEAAALDQLELGVAADWSFDSSGGRFELEGYKVVAGEVPDEVRGTDDDRSIEELHDPTLPVERVS